MQWLLLTLRQSVVSALDEYRRLDREPFLAKYGFVKSRTYFIKHDNALYDSKAIVGAAHAYEFGKPLRADEFSGGERTVKRKLEDLDFEVVTEWMDLEAQSLDQLKPGAVIDNRRLMSLFGIGLMGGMRRNVERGHLVVVSDHTKSLYEDRWVDNVLHYTGMGKTGDQTLTSQNKTVVEATAQGIKIYLFEVFVSGRYIFHGDVALDSPPYQETQPDQTGAPRKVWMFPLKLLAQDYQPAATTEQLQRIRDLRQRALRKRSLAELKQRAEASSPTPPTRLSLTQQIIRDEAVAAYVKRLAKGQCDLCRRDAPFIGKDKEPFLECHHVVYLAKDGPDTIDNAVALCPNCHRRMHVLDLQSDRATLLKRIASRT